MNRRTGLFGTGLVLALGLVATGWVGLVEATPEARAEDDGKAVFLAQKCNTCHSVPSQEIESKMKSGKMKGPDIAGLSHDAEALTKYLKKEAKLDDKDHPKEFKGSDDELATLVAWITQQK